MRIMVPIVALALTAGCSSSSQGGNDSANDAAAATPTPIVAATPVAPASPDTAATPRPGALKTFGDWAVGCDNVERCTLASLGPQSGDVPSVDLALQRGSTPMAPVTLSLQPIDTGNGPTAAPVAVAVDGKRTGGFNTAKDGAATLTGNAAMTVAMRMINGHRLSILGQDGAVLATLSLSGASAALRYMDTQQGRAGSVSAVVAKGASPAADVPPGPALPQIVAVVPIGRPVRVDKAAVAAMRKTARCDAQSAPNDVDTATLGGASSLVLVPCSAGAYNLSSAVFVRHEGKGFSPASFDVPVGFGGDGPVPMIVNGSFKDGVLTSDTLARGLGDCGVEQQFVWDGSAFRLSAQSEMGECRGNPHFIPTWRAIVTRR